MDPSNLLQDSRDLTIELFLCMLMALGHLNSTHELANLSRSFPGRIQENDSIILSEWNRGRVILVSSRHSRLQEGKVFFKKQNLSTADVLHYNTIYARHYRPLPCLVAYS
jgi:hypothetical protein